MLRRLSCNRYNQINLDALSPSNLPCIRYGHIHRNYVRAVRPEWRYREFGQAKGRVEQAEAERKQIVLSKAVAARLECPSPCPHPLGRS